MTISQKIKSDLIPFFSDLIPFFPEKSTQRKEKEKKKSKGNLSHSVQKEKYVWELFPPEKNRTKEKTENSCIPAFISLSLQTANRQI